MGSRAIPVRFQSSFRAILLGLKGFSILFFFIRILVGFAKILLDSLEVLWAPEQFQCDFGAGSVRLCCNDFPSFSIGFFGWIFKDSFRILWIFHVHWSF